MVDVEVLSYKYSQQCKYKIQNPEMRPKLGPLTLPFMRVSITYYTGKNDVLSFGM